MRMRLLYFESGNLTLTEDYTEHVPPYAILSHTWGKNTEEGTLDDLKAGNYIDTTKYIKFRICGEQAAKDGLQYFWIDTSLLGFEPKALRGIRSSNKIIEELLDGLMDSVKVESLPRGGCYQHVRQQ